MTKYSIGIEQSYLTAEDKGDSPKDESFNIPTSDGKTVRVNIEFSYRFDEARVSETFAMFKGKSGEAIKDSFIKPKVVAWTQEVSANYPVTDIFGDKRTEINAELDTYLREKFDQYGIIIDTVNFTDISVDDETAAAIQKKVTAQQELELANIEKQTAKVQAEKDREVAQINAEKAVIEAEAKAETLRIAAEAEADANRKIAASLTNELIEKIKYEQWNGELPTVTGSTPIIRSRTVMEKWWDNAKDWVKVLICIAVSIVSIALIILTMIMPIVWSIKLHNPAFLLLWCIPAGIFVGVWAYQEFFDF